MAFAKRGTAAARAQALARGGVGRMGESAAYSGKAEKGVAWVTLTLMRATESNRVEIQLYASGEAMMNTHVDTNRSPKE